MGVFIIVVNFVLNKPSLLLVRFVKGSSTVKQLCVCTVTVSSLWQCSRGKVSLVGMRVYR
jgi:hypothetical protein